MTFKGMKLVKTNLSTLLHEKAQKQYMLEFKNLDYNTFK